MRLPRRHPRSVYAVYDAKEALGDVDESAFEDLHLDEGALTDVAAPPAGPAAVEAESPAPAAETEWPAPGAPRGESGSQSPRARRVLAGAAVFIATAFILVASALVVLGGASRPATSERRRLSHGVAARRTGAAAMEGARIWSDRSKSDTRGPQALRSAASSAPATAHQASTPPLGSSDARLHKAAGRRSVGGPRLADVAATLHPSPALGSIEPPSPIATCGCSAADLEFGFER